jgi:Tfp pilus assembly protein PilF
MYTTKGFSGIEGLLTKDTFFGFFKEKGKDQLVAGGRYRPLTLVLFAIEYQFFGENPLVGHLINALAYAILGIVVYFLLMALFSRVIPGEKIALFAFLGAMIYIFHPVHTEAVANIKGRDEILTMMFGCMSWLLLLKGKNYLHYIGGGALFFLALLSKENAITLVPLIGLGYWMLQHGNVKDSIKISVPVIIASALYLIIRFSILGNSIGNEPLEMMNNPFVKFENGEYSFFTTGERWATIMAGLGEYLRLLVFPHPLTHDYYPREFGVMKWTDISVIISCFLHLLLLVAALMGLKKYRIISFSILFYFATIAIFSNIIFPIGTHISERFLFMPSLSFAIILGYIISTLFYYKKTITVLVLAGLFLGACTYKTVTRNLIWKDNFTLFTTDVQVSNNSAKALNAAGGALTDASKTELDEAKKNQMLVTAKKYLEKALNIHPNYKNAWLILGNVYYFLGDSENALGIYDKALALDPSYREARKNKALVLRVVGREEGEKNQNLQKAMDYFRKSFQLNSQDAETVRLLGLGEGMLGNHENAIRYFQRFTQMAPQNAYGYVLLSQAYQNAGNTAQADINRRKALSIDPNVLDK